MSRDAPSNSDDTIDSRQVISRLEDLYEELEDAFNDERAIPLKVLHEAQQDELEADHNDQEDREAVAAGDPSSVRDPYEREEFDEYLMDDAPEGAFNEWLADQVARGISEAVEYQDLRDFADQGEGYGGWDHGETLIRDSYFPDYAEELANDIGAINRDAGWPLSHIDWEAAADALKIDYTEVSFDGVSYWMRS